MELEYLLENPKGRCLPRFIRANFPDEYKVILGLPGDKFSEKIYRYFNPDVNNECVVCGRPTKFKTLLKGFARTCCPKCSTADPERTKKAKQTNIQRYGTANYNNREKFLESMDGRIWGFKDQAVHDTIRERYGVDNISQRADIKEKKEATCLRNHGVTNALKLERVREAGKSAMIEKYGTDALFKIPEFQKQIHESRKLDFIESHPDIVGILSDGTWICKCPHLNCNECTERTYLSRNQIYNDRRRNGSELCTKLLPIGRHNQGTTIELFIRNILDKYNISYQTNVRTIVSPKEIDIYCPDYGIAIECNGVYWHSIKPSGYHKEKFEACSNAGIQLLTIWEDWVQNKPNIVESVVLSKFGIYGERIGARKCKVVEVSSKIAQQFFDDNHIQGKCKSKVRLGLEYNGRLVAVMAFNNRSKMSGSSVAEGWELIRFCSLVNLQIIGGAERLLKHFISQYKPAKIVSFSSNDISNGLLYKRLKFKEYSSSLAYWYIQQGTLKRYHRTSFCKTRLAEMGMDTTKTEREIMDSLPYWRIYDSGTTGWELNINEA